MAEVSKCTTVSIVTPQSSVNMTNFRVLRDNTTTTAIYTNEDLTRYSFAADVTVSNVPISAAAVELTVGGKRAIAVEYGDIPVGSRTITIPGSMIKQHYGWSTIGNMLNTLGLSSATSTSICMKLVW